MTTYNTGNPVGSVDVRDLYDNSENLDYLSAGTADSYLDRLGISRKSWAGMESNFQASQSSRDSEWTAFLLASGYQVLGAYGAGLVFTSYNQTFSYLGEFYAPSASVTLPYTTTGVGAAEIATFRSVGDAILRADLAAPTGTDEIGRGVGTLEDALDAIELRATNLEAGATVTQSEVLALETFDLGVRTSDESPLVVDMHYGTLVGAGWTASEPPFSVTGYSVATTYTVSVGAMDIPVASTTNFAAGMLIAYVATDGRFYPARIHSILAGPIVRLDRQTVAPIASGGLIWNVYRDDAHPNAAGGNLIADDALRQLNGGRLRKLEWRGNDGSIWRAVGAASLSSVTAVEYTNPGTVTIGERPALVTGTAADQGVSSAPVALVGGDYIARVQVNTGTRSGGFSGAVEVAVEETRADGVSFIISTSGAFAGYSSSHSIELQFSIAPGSIARVRVTSPNNGGWTFTAGQLEYHRLEGRALNLNRGRHVLFGDSWFVSGGAIHNSMIARLPDAEVLSAGIVGNKADQMIARFTADVAALAPDFVWVMVGTNDYYAGVTPALFEQQILQLRGLIQSIGAQAIFFTPSVGAVTYGPPQLHPSRRYALNVNYHEVAPSALGPGVVQRSGVANIQGLSVAAGATVTAWVFPALTRKVAYLRVLSVNTAAVNVRFEYCSTPDGAGGVEPTIYNTTSAVRDVPLPRASDTELRSICIRINNPSGAAIVVSLTADVCWTQDLV